MIESKVELVQAIGGLVFLVEIGLLIWLLWKGRSLSSPVKWMALIALIIGPVLMVFLGNFYVFDHSKTVDSCGSCHVMKPMVTDLKDPESMTLAARHYKNNWITKNECYGCHKEYGLNGPLLSKLTGYRHMMRYITKTHEVPIVARAAFQYNNCTSCHSTDTGFGDVEMHQPLLAKFAANEISCLNCHGRAHPTRSERTPGTASYDRLMSFEPVEEDVQEYLQTISKATQP